MTSTSTQKRCDLQTLSMRRTNLSLSPTMSSFSRDLPAESTLSLVGWLLVRPLLLLLGEKDWLL